MTDFVSDGDPFEAPERGAAEGYAQTPAPLTKAFPALMGQASAEGEGGVAAVAQHGQFEGSSLLAQSLYQTATADQYGQPLDPDAPTAGSVKSPILTPQEYNDRYAPTGADGKPVSLGSDPMPEGVAQLIGKAKGDELQREAVISRFENSHSWPVNFATGLAASMTDPLNIATTFIPGFGEEATAARLGGGIVGRTAGRIVSGAAAGAASQVPLIALKMGLSQETATDYSMRDAMNELLYSAAGNAIVHAGFGSIRELGGPPSIDGGAPEGTEPSVPSPIEATTNYDAMRASVSQLVDGRQVDVDSPFFYRPPQAATAVGQLLDRKYRPEIVAGDTAEAEARRAFPDVYERYDPLLERVNALREELDDPEKTIGSRIDARIQELREQGLETQTPGWEQARQEAADLEAQRAEIISAQSAGTRADLTTAEEQVRAMAPEISAAMRQAEATQSLAAASRATIMGPPRVEISPSEFASKQRQVYEAGFAPGMTADRLHASDVDLFGTPEERLGHTPDEAAESIGNSVETSEPKPLENAEGEASRGETGGQPKKLSPEEQAMADLESRIDQTTLTADERASLQQSADGVESANFREAAYQQAAQCILESEG